MATEEQDEVIAIDLDEIDLDEIDAIYEKVKAVFVEADLKSDPLGWTKLIFVFRGFLEQVADATGVCPACLADSIMHQLIRRFPRDDAEHSHAVH